MSELWPARQGQGVGPSGPTKICGLAKRASAPEEEKCGVPHSRFAERRRRLIASYPAKGVVEVVKLARDIAYLSDRLTKQGAHILRLQLFAPRARTAPPATAATSKKRDTEEEMKRQGQVSLSQLAPAAPKS
jgi:predicted RNase H-like nuclease